MSRNIRKVYGHCTHETTQECGKGDQGPEGLTEHDEVGREADVF